VTTYEKAIAIIVETLPECKGLAYPKVADRILRALAAKRIVPTTIAGSPAMRKRWHAHCRWLAREIGETYDDLYNKAIAYAVERSTWPIKIVPTPVEINGVKITVDIQVPQSTTKATNKQLIMAYEYIEFVAKEHGKVLPESWEDEL